MFQPFKRSIFPFSPPVIILMAAGLGLFFLLGSRAITEPDEGRYAETAREMTLQSSWLVPHLGGVPHLTKPPMTYWITAACIKHFGVNEWAVRLPPAFAALGVIWLIMHVGGLLFRPSVSWKAGLILLTSGLFFVVARIINTDMLLCFWITAAIVAFVHYSKRKNLFALVVFYTCLGLGFLTKGPIAYLVSLSAVIPWALANREEPKPKAWGWHWFPGLIFALAISLSWFVLLFRQHPELITYYWQNEFVDRIASDTHMRTKPLWYYSFALLGGMFPWSLFLPRTIRDLWKRRSDPWAPSFWLLAGWILIPFTILHLVHSKLPTYLVPLLPPMALVLAYHWDRLESRWKPEIRVVSALLAFILFALPIVLLRIGRGMEAPIFALPWFIAGALLLGLGWLALCILSAKRLPGPWQFKGTGALLLATLLLATSQADTQLLRRNRNMKSVAEDIKAAQTLFPDAILAAPYMKRFSLEFYLQEPILRSVSSVESVLPIPEEVHRWYVEDPFRYFQQNPDKEFLILISRIFLPDPLPENWTIMKNYMNMVLIHQARDS